MTSQKTIYDLAHAQGGVIRIDQALEAGYSRAQIKRRVDRGDWRALASGVYRLLDLDGPLNLARAAVAVLPDAVVSHFSAAALHNIPLVPRDVVSVTVHARTTHAFSAVRVFRSFDLAPSHIAQVAGLPTTSIERTVVDLAACLSQKHIAAVVDEVLASGMSDIDRISQMLESVARKGRKGVRKLRSVLDSRRSDPERATNLERAGLKLLREAGFDGFVIEHPIPWDATKRFDVAFPAHGIAIEWDSIRWHTQMSVFQSDRRRDRDAIVHGWRVLRFTWDDVHKAPGDVIATIRAAIETTSAIR